MGDPWQKKQVENFAKQRDAAVAEVQALRLFLRPEIMTTKFTLHPIIGAQFVCEENLLVVTEDSVVRVLRGYETIGTVVGESAAVLCEALNLATNPRAAKIRISHVAPESGVAQAELVNE